MIRTTVYLTEGTGNLFTKRLAQIYQGWERSPANNRTSWPLCDSQRVYRNQNGLGIELDYLPLTMPPEFDGATVRMVTIEDDYLDGNGLMRAGTYRRGRSNAVVTMRMQRSSGRRGHTPYACWKIEIVGERLESVTRLYTDIRAGKVEPQVQWDSEDCHPDSSLTTGDRETLLSIFGKALKSATLTNFDRISFLDLMDELGLTEAELPGRA